MKSMLYIYNRFTDTEIEEMYWSALNEVSLAQVYPDIDPLDDKNDISNELLFDVHDLQGQSMRNYP